MSATSVFRLDNCEIPIELRHKLYLDFRGRYQAALGELGNYLKGVEANVAAPKQAVIAAMIESANAELWGRLAAGPGREWGQREAAEVVRTLRSDELEAAVEIGEMWSGRVYKLWNEHLANRHSRALNTSDRWADRLIRALAANGILEEARDLDYSKRAKKAWCDTGLLWIIRRAARRSGLFPKLPPQLPESLSGLLAYERPMTVLGPGWYAERFMEPIQSVLDANRPIIAAVARLAPPGTWTFKSPDDREPVYVTRYLTLGELMSANVVTSPVNETQSEQEIIGFGLPEFDNLGVLRA